VTRALEVIARKTSSTYSAVFWHKLAKTLTEKSELYAIRVLC